MMQETDLIYSPALRMKEGELLALGRLSEDVARYVLPRLIVPPARERGGSSPMLFAAARQPDISSVLAANWLNLPALIDVSYIIEEFGRANLVEWLPAMFSTARNRGGRPIPLLHLSSVDDVQISAFKASIAFHEKMKVGICVAQAEVDPLAPRDLVLRIHDVLARLGVSIGDCAIIVDFAEAEFGDPNIVAPIIGAALETIRDIGAWAKIIFQGTHYPDKNPAPDGGYILWPRNEWLAWQAAVRFDPNTAKYMIFGDYAADCAKIDFGESGGRAIRHIRYLVGDHWRIQRAAKSGSDCERMRDVYKAIVASGGFAGHDFSDADAFIANAARDGVETPGNASTWRQLNMTHHITHVIADIGRVRGIPIRRMLVDQVGEQPSFL